PGCRRCAPGWPSWSPTAPRAGHFVSRSPRHPWSRSYRGSIRIARGAETREGVSRTARLGRRSSRSVPGPVGESGRLFEQVCVRAGAGQLELPGLLPVDQDPIGLDVAITPAFPFAAERVIPVLRVQSPAGAQRLDDGAELLQVLAALLQALQVPLELRSRAGRQR